MGEGKALFANSAEIIGYLQKNKASFDCGPVYTGLWSGIHHGPECKSKAMAFSGENMREYLPEMHSHACTQ